MAFAISLQALQTEMHNARGSNCPNVLQPDVNMKDQEGRVVGSEEDWALTAAKLTTFSSQAGLCRFHVGCN